MVREYMGSGMKIKGVSLTSRVIIAGVSVLALVVSWRNGPMFRYDSVSYIAHAAYREPVYPLLLGFFKLLPFGKGYSVLVFSQTVSVLAASVYLSFVLFAFYGLTETFFLLCFATCVTPLFLFDIGANLLSEAAAYSLFLFFTAVIAKCLRTERMKDLLVALLLSILAVLTRPQLVVTYFAWVCAAGYLVYLHRTWRRMIYLLCALLMAHMAGSLFNRAYHAYYNGIFQGTKGGGMYLAAEALYVSDKSDLSLFSSASYYPLMVSIYDQMEAGRLFSLYRHESDQNMAYYAHTAGDRRLPYISRMTTIHWYILAKKLYLYQVKGDFAARWDTDMNDFAMEERFNSEGKHWGESDLICKDIFNKILAKRLTEYLKFQGSMFKYRFHWMELCFWVMFCCPFIFRLTPANVLVSILSACNIMHLVLIGLTGVAEPRIGFYSYVSQVICIILLAAQYRPVGFKTTA